MPEHGKGAKRGRLAQLLFARLEVLHGASQQGVFVVGGIRHNGPEMACRRGHGTGGWKRRGGGGGGPWTTAGVQRDVAARAAGTAPLGGAQPIVRPAEMPGQQAQRPIHHHPLQHSIPCPALHRAPSSLPACPALPCPACQTTAQPVPCPAVPACTRCRLQAAMQCALLQCSPIPAFAISPSMVQGYSSVKFPAENTPAAAAQRPEVESSRQGARRALAMPAAQLAGRGAGFGGALACSARRQAGNARNVAEPCSGQQAASQAGRQHGAGGRVRAARADAALTLKAAAAGVSRRKRVGGHDCTARGKGA